MKFAEKCKKWNFDTIDIKDYKEDFTNLGVEGMIYNFACLGKILEN